MIHLEEGEEGKGCGCMLVQAGPPAPDAIGRGCGPSVLMCQPSRFEGETIDEEGILIALVLLGYPILFDFRVPVSEPFLCLLVLFDGLFQSGRDLGQGDVR